MFFSEKECSGIHKLLRHTERSVVWRHFMIQSRQLNLRILCKTYTGRRGREEIADFSVRSLFLCPSIRLIHTSLASAIFCASLHRVICMCHVPYNFSFNSSQGKSRTKVARELRQHGTAGIWTFQRLQVVTFKRWGENRSVVIADLSLRLFYVCLMDPRFHRDPKLLRAN